LYLLFIYIYIYSCRVWLYPARAACCVRIIIIIIATGNNILSPPLRQTTITITVIVINHWWYFNVIPRSWLSFIVILYIYIYKLINFYFPTDFQIKFTWFYIAVYYNLLVTGLRDYITTTYTVICNAPKISEMKTTIIMFYNDKVAFRYPISYLLYIYILYIS